MQQLCSQETQCRTVAVPGVSTDTMCSSLSAPLIGVRSVLSAGLGVGALHGASIVNAPAPTVSVVFGGIDAVPGMVRLLDMDHAGHSTRPPGCASERGHEGRLM